MNKSEKEIQWPNPINYHCSIIIHLALEGWHNLGLTPEETKAEIEAIRVGNTNLWCERGGINSNWNVRVAACSDASIAMIVGWIEARLYARMIEKSELAAANSPLAA